MMKRRKAMSQQIYRVAYENYVLNDRWSKEMLDNLLKKKKLTQSEYDALIEAKEHKDE